MSFLDDLVNQRSELETPLSFYYWAGLATLSAVINDQVWLTMGGSYYNVYPNIYVMLHAKSGLKKGPPVAMARNLVSKVNNTRVINGRSSIQGIMSELKESYTLPGGKVVNKAIAFICASELSSSLVEDTAAMNILTDLYDRSYYEGTWGHRLKDAKFELKKPTITMLTATNEAHSEQIFQKKDIQGGYIARTFIIYADQENKTNSLIYPLTNPPNNDEAIKYLLEVSKLNGPFKSLYDTDTKRPTEAGEYYDNWYNKILKTYQKEIEDETGTLNRFGDSVLKIAMLLSLSRGTSLEISLADMTEAVEQCEKLLPHTQRVTRGKSGKSAYANQKVKIIEILMKREPHMITRSQLSREMTYHLNPTELDEIMLMFDRSGIVKTENQGGVTMYVMPEDQYDKLKNFKGMKK